MERETEQEMFQEAGRKPEKPAMKVEYLREMRQNYLMIEADEGQGQGYEARMMADNTIEGLLKFRIKKTDSRCKFCYEITSKQPLSRLLEAKTIGEAQLRELLFGIARILTRMEDYLLTEGQLLMDPDYIYVEPEEYQPFLCLIPGKKGDFPREFSLFLQFLLGKVDHQDKEAVVLVYGLYRESLKENYGLDNLMKWLVKKEEDCPVVESLSEDKRCETITSEKIQSWEAEETAQRRETHHCQSEEGSGIAPIKPWYLYFLPAAVMFSLAVGIWLFFGRQGLERYGIWMAAAGAGMLAAGGGFCMYQLYNRQKTGMPPYDVGSHEGQLHRQESSGNQAVYDQMAGNQEAYGQRSYHQTSNSKTSGNQQNQSRQASQEEPSKISASPGQWQMIFEEPLETGSEETSVLPEPEEMHTVLLWNQGDVKKDLSLVGKDSGEKILLPYFPFIIGKQEGLCDHVISKSTVSRLHIRVDKIEDGYQVTDLNSTNGTYVNGRCLEANETAKVQPGDEIGVADLKFRLE